MVDLGIPELTEEQIEEISRVAERAAKKIIFSKVSQKQIEKIDITIEAEGLKPVNFAVEIELTFSKTVKGFEEKNLADEGVKEAFRAIENYLRNLK